LEYHKKHTASIFTFSGLLTEEEVKGGVSKEEGEAFTRPPQQDQKE
jgi:hypothetical protein